MRWEKRGLVYAPTGDQWWARSYAHLPTAHVRSDGTVRVYFAGLDENRFGRIGYVDVSTKDPTRVVAAGDQPVLDLGEIGTFEDSGVVPCSVVETDEGVRLYYHGFQRTERVPYLIFAGLVESRPKGNAFVRRTRTPLLERTEEEPFIRGAPCVLVEDGCWRMWYVSCTHWSRTEDRLHYNNEIRHATSVDGIHWQTDSLVSLKPLQPDEYSVGRPSVMRMRDGYHMWYSSRSHSVPYRIAHATSPDGRHWERDPSFRFDPSPAGWDSEMTCYANTVCVNGQWWMFYNGNGHGRSGFGVAMLAD